ncbi:hypothetical protein ACN28C_10885 [Plantactinospora sp. WMMC1484]|uniref:hypothetical protein n=1 Tax=Plantactinospora sp. WMMC1484 TaxID=3404122 RepID=UPI003BF4D365
MTPLGNAITPPAFRRIRRPGSGYALMPLIVVLLLTAAVRTKDASPMLDVSPVQTTRIPATAPAKEARTSDRLKRLADTIGPAVLDFAATPLPFHPPVSMDFRHDREARFAADGSRRAVR